VKTILSKATQRLYILKLLNYAGVPNAQLLHFYVTVMRPILHYTAPIWHYLLSKCQTDQIAAIQKTALNIIFICTMPHSSALFLAGLTSLTVHREQLTGKCFNSIFQPRSCLHHLLPPPCDSFLLTCLRDPHNSLVFSIELKSRPINLSSHMPSATIRTSNFLMYVFLS